MMRDTKNLQWSDKPWGKAAPVRESTAIVLMQAGHAAQGSCVWVGDGYVFLFWFRDAKGKWCLHGVRGEPRKWLSLDRMLKYLDTNRLLPPKVLVDHTVPRQWNV